MSRTAERASQVASASAASYLLERVREWWRTQNELSHLDRSELERIAGDLGVTVHDLEELVARGRMLPTSFTSAWRRSASIATTSTAPRTA